jgi:hypothetical protein
MVGFANMLSSLACSSAELVMVLPCETDEGFRIDETICEKNLQLKPSSCFHSYSMRHV